MSHCTRENSSVMPHHHSCPALSLFRIPPVVSSPPLGSGSRLPFLRIMRFFRRALLRVNITSSAILSVKVISLREDHLFPAALRKSIFSGGNSCAEAESLRVYTVVFFFSHPGRQTYPKARGLILFAISLPPKPVSREPITTFRKAL